MPSTEHLLVERDDHTLIITMNRPEAKNALSPAMLAGMADAWVELDGDDDMRCAILTGAGGSFCTGMDLKAAANDNAGPNPYADRWAAEPGSPLEGPAAPPPPAQAVDRRRGGPCRRRRHRDPPGHPPAGGGRERDVRAVRGAAGAVPGRWVHGPPASPDRLHARARDVARRAARTARRRRRTSGSSATWFQTVRHSPKRRSSPR